MAKAIPKTYKYGVCAECGLGLWRDGKCFLYPFHSQEPAQVEVNPAKMTLDTPPQLQIEGVR